MGTPFGKPSFVSGEDTAATFDRAAAAGSFAPFGDDNDTISARKVPLGGEMAARDMVQASRRARLGRAAEPEAIVPCFTPDVQLATQRGLVRAEDLVRGDKLVTRDNGFQEIRWIGRKQLRGTELLGSPNLQPVLIRKGALGAGLPERDMLVSPNHRMLVSSEHLIALTGEREGLAAAKLLVGQPGIHRISPVGLTYIHFMFDRHEVVLSDGAWTESFQPGDYSLRGIDEAQREELFALFPELRQTPQLDSFIAARPTLRAVDAEILKRR